MFYLHEAEDLCSLHLKATTSKCKHLLVEISVQRVQLTNIILLNSKGSHRKLHERCFLCSVTNYLASDIKTCIQLQLNCEYQNSAISVYSVYQFINNKYICLILPN